MYLCVARTHYCFCSALKLINVIILVFSLLLLHVIKPTENDENRLEAVMPSLSRENNNNPTILQNTSVKYVVVCAAETHTSGQRGECFTMNIKGEKTGVK